MKYGKKHYIITFIVMLLCITFGFAALNTTININGKSSISKNTWDVHFDNIVVKDGSTGGIKLPTVDNQTAVSFEVKLDLPGDYYEFTVDVVNNGSIDAMIESITKEPELTTEQQKYLNYVIEYQNGEQITSKQLVKSNEFVRLKVRVEYKNDIVSSDLPTTTEILNLEFTINYIQADRSGVSVTDNGIYNSPITIMHGDGTNTGDKVCIGEECFYVMYSDNNSVTLLSRYNLYVGGKYNQYSYNTPYIIEEYGNAATGIQDSLMAGIIIGHTARHGVVAFSNTNYWNYTASSYPAYVYNENSTLYSYVENYKEYLSTLGVMPMESRLITYEELMNLGCHVSNNTIYCTDAPSWVYSNSYWTGTAADQDYNVFAVKSIDKTLFTHNFGHNTEFGCRPVIVIDRHLVDRTYNSSPNILEFTIEEVTYQVEEGMTWGEWVDSEYSKDEFYFDDNIGVLNSKSTDIQIYQCVRYHELIDVEISYYLNPYIGSSGGGVVCGSVDEGI